MFLKSVLSLCFNNYATIEDNKVSSVSKNVLFGVSSIPTTTNICALYQYPFPGLPFAKYSV